MKLPFNQLESHLQRSLSGLYLIAADEPLLVLEATDRVRRQALSQGFEERKVYFVDRGFRWDRLEADGDTLSLFSSRRIVEIRMATPRPGDAGAKAIRALAETADPDRLVIVSIQARLDKPAQQSVWVKKVEQHGVVVDIRPIGRSELPRFITARGRQKGLSVDSDAAELLADRTEGNLLAADQELTKLALITDSARIDARRVQEAVASDARFDVFRLGDALLAGDLERSLIVLDGLRAEGAAAPLVLWAVVREITTLAELRHAQAHGRNISDVMTKLRIWRSRQGLVRQALSRYSDADVARLLASAVHADRSVKGMDYLPAWEAITGLVLELLAPAEYRRRA